MEKGVHYIRVRDLVRRLEHRLQEQTDLGQSTLGHRFDVRATHVNATGETVVELGEEV